MSTPSTPDAPRTDTLATEVFDDAPSPTMAAATATGQAPAAPQAPALPEPTYLSGPAPFAVVLGLLAVRRRLSLWEYVVLVGLAVGTVVAARNGVWLLLFLAAPAATSSAVATYRPPGTADEIR